MGYLIFIFQKVKWDNLIYKNIQKLKMSWKAKWEI